jgi:hypothetical protein
MIKRVVWLVFLLLIDFPSIAWSMQDLRRWEAGSWEIGRKQQEAGNLQGSGWVLPCVPTMTSFQGCLFYCKMYGVTLYDAGCHYVMCYTLHRVTAAIYFFGHQGALSCLRHLVKHYDVIVSMYKKTWHLYVYFISCWQKLYYSRQTHNKMANRLCTALAHYCSNSIL